MTEEQLAEAMADLEIGKIRDQVRAGMPLSMSCTIQGHTFDIDGDASFEEKVEAVHYVVRRSYLNMIQRARALGFMIVQRQ